MNGLRVVLVTQRFWPLAGREEKLLQWLAEGLDARGVQTTIVTSQWQSSWPEKYCLGNLPVVRLPQSELPVWGVLRHMAALSGWINDHLAEIDVVCVSGLDYTSFAALGSTLGAGLPTVLRAERNGPRGACRWQDQATFGWAVRSRCQSAEMIVAPCQAVVDELLTAGYAREKIRLLPNGVPIPQAADADAISEMRLTLAEISGICTSPGPAPLGVFVGKLENGQGLFDLLHAWATVVRHFPAAQLWLAGEGKQRPELEAVVEALGLAGKVFLPGVFDDATDLIAAADVVVHPAHHEGGSLALLEALAGGAACVATDVPGNRAAIRHEENGLLVPRGDVGALSRAICRILGDRPLASAMGLAGRGRAAREFPSETMIDAHLSLFHELAASRRAGAA